MKSLLRFLSLAGYRCRFYKNDLDITVLLTGLLKKKAGFAWYLSCQQTFDQIKNLVFRPHSESSKF